MIPQIIAALVAELFKKKPYRLWGIRYNETKWKDFGTGSKKGIDIYAAYLFTLGYRTLIIGKDMLPPDPKAPIELKDSIGE